MLSCVKMAHYATHCQQFYSFNRFPGAQPISFTKESLSGLENEK